MNEEHLMQEQFDIIVTGLFNQARVSFSPVEDCCALRGNYGTKCSVGWLIKDDRYSAKMESWGIEKLVNGITDLWGSNVNFLEQARRIHDQCPPRDWPSEFRSLAFKRGLSIETLEKMEPVLLAKLASK